MRKRKWGGIRLKDGRKDLIERGRGERERRADRVKRETNNSDRDGEIKKGSHQLGERGNAARWGWEDLGGGRGLSNVEQRGYICMETNLMGTLERSRIRRSKADHWSNHR